MTVEKRNFRGKSSTNQPVADEIERSVRGPWEVQVALVKKSTVKGSEREKAESARLPSSSRGSRYRTPYSDRRIDRNRLARAKGKAATAPS